MFELLKQYENKAPEIVFEWHDKETEAVGWVVINSLRGGACCGVEMRRSCLNWGGHRSAWVERLRTREDPRSPRFQPAISDGRGATRGFFGAREGA